MTEILVCSKVSVFYSKIKKTSPKSSQRFYLAQTLNETQKNTSNQRLDQIFIPQQKEKAKN